MYIFFSFNLSYSYFSVLFHNYFFNKKIIILYMFIILKISNNFCYLSLLQQYKGNEVYKESNMNQNCK